MIGAIRERVRKLQRNLNLRRTVRLIWSISEGWTSLTVLLILIESALYIGLLYTFKGLINEVAKSIAYDHARTMKVMWYLIITGSGTILFVIIKAISSMVTEIQASRVNEAIDDKIHDCAINLDLGFYESPAYFDTMKRAREAGPERPNAVVLNLVDIAKNGMTLLAIGSVLISISWLLMPLLALFILPTLWVRITFADKMYQWRRAQTPLERKAAYFSSLITEDVNAKEVRSYRLGGTIRTLYTRIRNQLLVERLKLTRRNTFIELLTNLLATLGLFACIGYLCYSLIQGRTSVGDITLFLVVFPQSFGVMQVMSGCISGLYYNNIYVNNLFELFDLEPTMKETSNPLPVPTSGAMNLDVEGVSFTYPHAKEPTLQDITLQVPSGKIIAIVGLNGAGKTTLIKLLCRLYDPSEGQIRMGGTDIRKFNSAEYRKHISVVFQDFGKYNVSATDNIRWGDVEGQRPASDIEEAARKSGAHDYISQFDNEYNTMMGRLFENGREVSIGQWQKLAIARSYYSNSRFVIFDEATSALDALAEDNLFQSFRESIGHRAALIISHRLSAVKHADHIYVLSGGKIQQQGTHEELIAVPGDYARLFVKTPTGTVVTENANEERE